MAKITEDQKLQMNILYKRLGTYAAVAREIGCAVPRYRVEDFIEPEKIQQKLFVPAILPELDLSLFSEKTLAELCVLSIEEKEEVRELWKEMLM